MTFEEFYAKGKEMRPEIIKHLDPMKEVLGMFYDAGVDEGIMQSQIALNNLLIGKEVKIHDR